MEARAHIGTSGWNYKHWREIIYPPGLAQKRWLSYYSERFDTVEVNTSFYRIPTKETVEAWQQQTQDRFRFALKLWRGITHYRKLVNSVDLLERFFASADVLKKSRRGPLLVQLPPNQSINLEKLERFFDDLHPFVSRQWQVAVEFRNNSWLTAGTNAVLTRHHAALCLHDMGGTGAVNEPNRASFVFIRRHGYGARYSGNYSDNQIQEDAKRVGEWLASGRSVWVYYNNDVGGHAFRNAAALRAAVS